MTSLIGKLLDAGRRKAQRGVFYVAAKALDLYCDLGLGEMPLATDQLKEAAAILRANQGATRACEVHHFILSSRKGTPNQEAFPTLKLTARDWINEYAPGRKWVAAMQDHNGSPHLHLLVQNVGDDGKALKIHQWQVRAMANMEFTEHAAPAKGIGKKGLKFYSKAPDLDVRDLALDLATALRPGDDLQAVLKKRPDLSNFRFRKNGSIISFVFRERPMRVDTLEFYLAESTAAATPEIAPPAPPAPVPPPSSTAASPPPQPESPLDQFVRIGQRARRAQNQTKPGVNAPGTNIK